jgi:hypothetical protein
MWIAPRVQFSGRPSGAPSELDANLIRRHIYHINNPSLKKPNLRPRAITYFQPFLVQRLGSTSLQHPPGQDLAWRDRDGEVRGPQALGAMFDLNKIRSLELSKDVSCDCFTDVGGGCLGLS